MPPGPLTRTVRTGVKHERSLRGGYAHTTYKNELTARGRTKLQDQYHRAVKIIKVEEEAGHGDSESAKQAKRIKKSTQDMLNEGLKKGPPADEGEPTSKQRKKKRPRKGILEGVKEAEKASRKAAALSAVARRGNKD